MRHRFGITIIDTEAADEATVTRLRQLLMTKKLPRYAITIARAQMSSPDARHAFVRTASTLGSFSTHYGDRYVVATSDDTYRRLHDAVTEAINL